MSELQVAQLRSMREYKDFVIRMCIGCICSLEEANWPERTAASLWEEESSAVLQGIN